MTAHVADFCRDPRFQVSYNRGKATGSWDSTDLRWRVYVACWAAERALSLDGDFVECGVNRGGMSLSVMDYVGFKNIDKTFFLLDTYCGFPKHLRHLAAVANRNGYEECYEAVVRTFADFRNVNIIRGSIPETLNQVKADRVCYLSLDMNCAEPEIAAMRYFWTKLVPGAIVLLDDYAFSESYRRQKNAFDALCRELNFNILSLPTGQGLICKV